MWILPFCWNKIGTSRGKAAGLMREKRKSWDVKSKNSPHFLLHIETPFPPLIIRRGWAAPHTGCLFQHPHYIPILLNARGKYALKMTLNNLGGPQRRRGPVPLAAHFQRRSAAQPDSSGSISSPADKASAPKIAPDLQFKPDGSWEIILE